MYRLFFIKLVDIKDGASSSSSVPLIKFFSVPHSNSKNFGKLNVIEKRIHPTFTPFVIHDFELYKRGLHNTKYLSILNARVKYMDPVRNMLDKGTSQTKHCQNPIDTLQSSLSNPLQSANTGIENAERHVALKSKSIVLRININP